MVIQIALAVIQLASSIGNPFHKTRYSLRILFFLFNFSSTVECAPPPSMALQFPRHHSEKLARSSCTVADFQSLSKETWKTGMYLPLIRQG